MKNIKIYFLVVIFLLPIILFAQNNFTHLCKMGIGDVADEDPGLFMMMILMAGALAGAFIVGAAVAVVLLSVVFLLIVGGIISSSVIVGLYNRSFTKGFRFFMILIGMIVGGIAGAITCGIAKIIFGFHYSTHNPYLFSGIGGIVGGAIVGFVTVSVIKTIYRYFKNRLDMNKIPSR